MPIIADIRQIETPCTVHLRRVNMNLPRQDKAGMLSFEIPKRLAQEAIENTRTQEEAERYVLNRVNTVALQWPESVGYGEGPGSTPTVKCGPSEREGSN